MTVDGIEIQLRVNHKSTHMGHFLLCGLLFEKLAASKGQVVVMGSNGYNLGLKRIKFEDVNFDTGTGDGVPRTVRANHVRIQVAAPGPVCWQDRPRRHVPPGR